MDSGKAGERNIVPFNRTPSARPAWKEVPSTRQRSWTYEVKPPKTEMGQMNYEGWIRFMIASGRLNPFELGVVDTVSNSEWPPSVKQRKVLWKALWRIFPLGCGKWGNPRST